MRSTLLFVAAMLFLLAPASAQLLLTQSSYPATATWATSSNGVYDSVATVYTTTNLPTNLGSRTPGTIWNFSSVSYYTLDTPAVIHATYTGFSYQDFALHIIAKPYLYFDARSLMNIGASGITKFGERIDGKGYSLMGLTGAQPNDSLIFPQQTDTFSALQNKIALPATYNSKWSSSYSSVIKFTLTYGGIYNHTPCTVKLHVSETDTVIGYGKVVVKRIDNQASDSINALEVKVSYNEVDSFFINGTAASATVLSAFGLAQGQTTNSTNEYRYLRTNETTPLADVFYTDNTFSTVSHVYISTQRIPLYTNVPEVAAAHDINVYPNPVTDRTFTLHIPASLLGASYRVVNIAGQVIVASSKSQNGDVSVMLPASVGAGMYYLQVYQAGKVINVKALEVK